MKTKMPLVVALSSVLTAALILASVGVYSLLQDRNQDRDRSTPASSPPAAPVNPTVNPTESATPMAQTPVITWTQAENDYLYDLSQALQPSERDRTTAAEKLAIGRQIQGWLDGGADYWGVRQKFDTAYKSAILGDYAHNRDVYLKFAIERLAPSHSNALTPPPAKVPVPRPAPGGGSGSNNPFIGGNPIPQKTATVTAKDFLNCRATPKDGAAVVKLQPGDAIEVNRVDYSTGKAWYLTTQGCWVSGNYIQIGGANPVPVNPDYREVYTNKQGFYKDAPGGNNTAPYNFGDKIQVSKYPSVDSSGAEWYHTPSNSWISKNDIN